MRVAALGCVFALAGCAQRTGETARAPADTVAIAHPEPAPALADTLLPLGLALKDDGRTVRVAPGQVVMVSLKANHTTGYRWVLADSALGVLEREGEPVYYADSTGGVGAGGFENWRFRATRAGSGTLVLEYRRPWEKGRAPETSVRYAVEVR
jgi:inhibitor of cysteine peptidase